MPRRQVHFYCTREDLIECFGSLARDHSLMVVLAGLQASPEPLVTETPFDSHNSRWTTYLMVPSADGVHVREVPQRSGGVMYAIDLLANPSAITFRPGLQVDATCLLEGEFGTLSETLAAIKLFDSFRRAITCHATRVGYCYVGRCAMDLLSRGARLAQDIKSPRESDIRVE